MRSLKPDSCNFALMSYAGSIDDYSAFGGTSWAKVNQEGSYMIKECMVDAPSPSGGVIVVPSSKSSMHMTYP